MQRRYPVELCEQTARQYASAESDQEKREILELSGMKRGSVHYYMNKIRAGKEIEGGQGGRPTSFIRRMIREEVARALAKQSEENPGETP